MSSSALQEWSACYALIAREQRANFFPDLKSVEVMVQYSERVSSILSIIQDQLFREQGHRDQLFQQQEYADTRDGIKTKKRRVVSRIIVYGTTPF
jgi:hypothetical protein